MLFLNLLNSFKSRGLGCGVPTTRIRHGTLHMIWEGVSWEKAKWESRQAAMRKPQVERKKLGVCQLEKTALFNKIFHRCYYLSTIQLRNCDCFASVWTKVGGRAWRRFLGQGMQGSHLFMGLRAREGAIKSNPVWTHFPLHLGSLFGGEEGMCISGFTQT